MTGQSGCVRIVLVDDGDSDIEVHQPPDPLEVGPALRGAGRWIGDQVGQGGGYQAARGPRLGPVVDSASRRGSSEDVVTPVLVPPGLALAESVTETALASPVGPLTVDASPATAPRESELTPRSWPARLRTGVVGRRSAILRLRPSPSLNLTIIELVPTRAPWFRSKSFVRAGVPAIAELAARIRAGAVATESAKTPTVIGKSTSRA